MRAVVINGAGQPPVVTDVSTPSAGPGEALVRVTAASINPVDVHIASGHFFDGPPSAAYTPGLEAVGVVEQGDALAPGTRVRVEIVHPGYGRDGTLAEYVVVPERPVHDQRASQAQVFPVGQDLTDSYLAAIGATGCTAVSLLDRVRETGGTLEGGHVLVLGATGSIGSILVQLAKRMGAAHVVGAGRDSGRLEKLVGLGADATVHLGEDEAAMREQFVEASLGRLDVVIEPLWGAPARAAMEALSPNGLLVNFGSVTGMEASMSALPLRNKRVTVAGYSGAWTTPEQRQGAYLRLLDLVTEQPIDLDVQELGIDGVPEVWATVTASAGKKYVVRPGLG